MNHDSQTRGARSRGRASCYNHRSGLARRVCVGLVLQAVLVCASAVTSRADSDWVSAPGCRYRELDVPAFGKTYLQELPPAAIGITFTNFLSEEKGLENSLRLGGSGVAAGDVDGDGWCDLFFCATEGPCALYRNRGGWQFEDVTESSGLALAARYSTGAVFADVDGDGDLDLLVNWLGGGTRLFLNDGKGRFTEAANCGLIRKFGSTSLALADVDGNGTLDLYVANFAAVKIEDRPNVRIGTKMIDGNLVVTALDGVPTSSPELANRYFIDPTDRVIRERGEADLLYLNDGRGNFSPVSWTGGTFLDEDGKPLELPPYDWGLTAMFRDMNGDLAPDLYVCNDLFPPDRIWVNDGDGHFRAQANLAVRSTSLFSMGVDFADLNRDGYDDFMVVDMLSRDHQERKTQVVGVRPLFLPIGKIDNRPQYKRNTVFLNRGDGTYAEIAQLSGLEATGWSWTPIFLDVDLDGFEDLLVTTGYTRDSLNADAIAEMTRRRANRKLSDAEYRELKKLFPRELTATQAFRNRGDLTFEDKAHEWGFDYVGISQGMCLADLDNDGDLDVVVNRLYAGPGIYRNETIAPRVAVRLKGRAPNTRGIGAKIRVLGGPVPQSQEMICGGRYLSGDDSMRTFAAGTGSNDLTLEVTWRSGAVSMVRHAKANRLYEIDEAGAVAGLAAQSSGTRNRAAKTLLTDVSALLRHTHHDEWYDDFERQPSLARKLSQLGPGVSWFDLDGDGWDDLIIGSGKGGELSVYRNDGRGGFTRWDEPAALLAASWDQTTVLGHRNRAGQTVVLVGSANYEDGSTNSALIRQLDFSRRTVDDGLLGQLSSIGPLALADVDGDGDLDLFAGGRVVPGRYGEPAASRIFHGGKQGFILDEANTQRLANVGMVSGAVFSDLDGDGWPDLVLAYDWGPLRCFHNNHGTLIEVTQQVGLARFTGFWNGVTAGDFDGDGRMDLVASNWGRNSKYQSYRSRPLRLFCSDLGGAGPFAALESYFDPATRKIVPWCGMATAVKALPWLHERFGTHAAYGAASMAELLGEPGRRVQVLEAAWLESTVFLNRGDSFTAVVLPGEAQFAPAFGVSVADVDGDGKEDIFLSQNFFATDGETSRYDAGRGLLLKGDGQGGFASLPGQQSGVEVYGEQRGCALADYDGDGRVDLVVTQNGAETRLYHNVGAKPGLRVRLVGPPGNPQGIGASVRLRFGERFGPAREIHAGAGYWSQDSAVPVMGFVDPPDGVWIRWPGGKEIVVTLPPGAKEVSVDPAGALKRLR